MDPDIVAFIRMVKHPVKFRMFLFFKLPSAFFAGVRIKEIDVNKCVVTVPYQWFSTNPFRSTYFACLAMAAEMSTGALSLAHINKKSPPVSMLITHMESRFRKKAAGVTTFICEEGAAIRQCIADAITSGEGRQVKVKSVGTNKEAEVVAEFDITWSFKARGKRRDEQ